MYVDTNGNPLMTLSISRWKELGAPVDKFCSPVGSTEQKETEGTYNV